MVGIDVESMLDIDGDPAAGFRAVIPTRTT
jgi:hypothetical protein